MISIDASYSRQAMIYVQSIAGFRCDTVVESIAVGQLSFHLLKEDNLEVLGEEVQNVSVGSRARHQKERTVVMRAMASDTCHPANPPLTCE